MFDSETVVDYKWLFSMNKAFGLIADMNVNNLEATQRAPPPSMQSDIQYVTHCINTHAYCYYYCIWCSAAEQQSLPQSAQIISL